MWPWASCSRRGAARALVALAAFAAGASHARVFLTQDEALRLAFGDATVTREAKFLANAQLARARELAGEGVEVESALVTRYTATKDGKLLGTAYFDTHTVRTLPETILVVVGPDARVARVEILSFGEPQDYLPKTRWLDQFPGRRLDHDLAVKRGIQGITGATLSARALTQATRRVLAIHQVLAEEGAPKRSGVPGAGR